MTVATENQPAVTFENARSADAAAVVAWLEQHHVDISGDPFAQRAVLRWKASGSGRASFHCVDRVFCALGMHVVQLPDSVWSGRGVGAR